MDIGSPEHGENLFMGYLLRDKFGETVNISRTLGGANPVVIGIALTEKLPVGKTIALDRQDNGQLEYYEVKTPPKKFQQVQKLHPDTVWVEPFDKETFNNLEKIGMNPNYTLDTLPLTQVVKDKLRIPKKQLA